MVTDEVKKYDSYVIYTGDSCRGERGNRTSDR